jgi:hypothetical protein
MKFWIERESRDSISQRETPLLVATLPQHTSKATLTSSFLAAGFSSPPFQFFFFVYNNYNNYIINNKNDKINFEIYE